MIQEKKQLRQQMLSLRDAMTLQERTQKSKSIMNRFLESDLYHNSDRVFCYISFRSEVETKELLKQMLCDGKKVGVPRVEGKEMHFYEILGLSDCKEGHFGILEPKEGLPEMIPELSNDFGIKPFRDLMIVPGSAFTVQGDRIGYGGGYYDRYLADYPVSTIGFFFDCQKADMIPCNQYDKKLSHILTESMFL